MMTVAGIQQFLAQDLGRIDASALSLPRRIGMHALRLGTAVVMEFRHRLLDARAAGLVYTTLLSLVPFLAVTVSVLKAFGVHQEIEPVLAQALEPLGSKGGGTHGDHHRLCRQFENRGLGNGWRGRPFVHHLFPDRQNRIGAERHLAGPTRTSVES